MSSLLASPGITLATSAIGAYQRYISPHKGFNCAHRALHRDDSCSEAVKKLIQGHGLKVAAPLIRDRFIACREAAAVIHAHAGGRGGSVAAVGEEKGAKDGSCKWQDSCALAGVALEIASCF